VTFFRAAAVGVLTWGLVSCGSEVRSVIVATVTAQQAQEQAPQSVLLTVAEGTTSSGEGFSCDTLGGAPILISPQVVIREQWLLGPDATQVDLLPGKGLVLTLDAFSNADASGTRTLTSCVDRVTLEPGKTTRVTFAMSAVASP
jgi:hypothetical protein